MLMCVCVCIACAVMDGQAGDKCDDSSQQEVSHHCEPSGQREAV